MKKNIKTPIMRGSVGSDTPIPIAKSGMLIERGVKKVRRRRILSSETKYSKRMKIPTGINAPQS